MNPPPTHLWPNAVDLTATFVFLAVSILLPAVGWVFMALDFRAYLRSLRRTLVRATQYMGELPLWAARETPRAVAAFGLRCPCSEEDLKRAYRRRVKQLHPDHGGDQRRFLLMQAQFEEALAHVAAATKADAWSIGPKAA